ncbi:PLP-dependent transferase [Coniochaeta sp. PMI_546]|nr:PLP-dependent transferase [Coniochaeta sp. PMI_546]
MSILIASGNQVKKRFDYSTTEAQMLEEIKATPTDGKNARTIRVKSLVDCETTSQRTLDSVPSGGEPKHSTSTSPPSPTPFDKIKEAGRLGIVRAKVFWQDIHPEQAEPHILLSPSAKFSHRYVEPLCFWWGKNSRLLLGQCLPTAQVQDIDGTASTVINATSHNYAGFYKAGAQSEELQRLCLQKLPLADAEALPLLESGAHLALAKFLGTDFCYTTSTGYGSNYAAFPALMSDSKTVVIADKNCHNSMFTGMYLAQPGHGRLLKFAHNDAADLEKHLREVDGRYDQVIVAVEGLYSMEADVPPLDDLWRLKEEYNFTLFCDEAHSLLSIGTTGRGCLEYWNDNHPDAPVPTDLIDIRTATLSKAIGGIGGMIAGKAKFEAAIRTHITQLRQEGGETLGSSTMVQTMWVLGQPTLVTRRLRRLADMSRFCRSELARFGIHVWGDEGTPMMPVYTGRPSYAARLSYVTRGYGLLASPVVAPAVPYWEGRVRINLSAEHTDEDVDKLINAVIKGSQHLNLCDVTSTERRHYKYNGPAVTSAQEKTEASTTYDSIRDIIDRSARSLEQQSSRSWSLFSSRCGTPISDVGVKAQQHFGLGSGGSRWISGTFPPHLKVESLITKITGTGDCLTYPDSHIGLASTIAALCRPVDGFRRHYMLLPDDLPRAVSDGFTLASPKDRPYTESFADIAALYSLLSNLSAKSAKTYFTVYLQAPTPDALLALRDVLGRLANDKPRRSGMTVLIHSPHCIPQDPVFVDFAQRPNMELLIYGSFHETMGLAGAYVAGSTGLLQELRFTSRGYMYTTSPQPFVMDMVRATLEKWLADAGVEGKQKLWLDGKQ